MDTALSDRTTTSSREDASADAGAFLPSCADGFALEEVLAARATLDTGMTLALTAPDGVLGITLGSVAVPDFIVPGELKRGLRTRPLVT